MERDEEWLDDMRFCLSDVCKASDWDRDCRFLKLPSKLPCNSSLPKLAFEHAANWRSGA